MAKCAIRRKVDCRGRTSDIERKKGVALSRNALEYYSGPVGCSTVGRLFFVVVLALEDQHATAIVAVFIFAIEYAAILVAVFVFAVEYDGAAFILAILVFAIERATFVVPIFILAVEDAAFVFAVLVFAIQHATIGARVSERSRARRERPATEGQHRDKPVE
jgi:hypothetical protein